MKIYFTASTTVDSGLVQNYKSIMSLLNGTHTIVSGKQIVNSAQRGREQKKGSEYIFELEKSRIDNADIVVAEVTSPSTGVGGEIVYALLQEKPVLALFYEDAGNLLSPMVAGNPSENLYLEHYTKDNINIVIRNFLSHVSFKKSRSGKLIVMEGGDGSGKETQAKLLVSELHDVGKKAKYMSFPRYYSSFHGRFVGRYLKGEFGGIDNVSPYMAALAYALDRASAREEIEAYLSSGGYVVCDRYVTSSMAHLSANLPEKERSKFIEWVDELEYRQHKMPRPDIVIYLYVPWKIGATLTKKGASSRKYSKIADIHEENNTHRIEAEKMYMSLAGSKRNWMKVDCVDNNDILPIDTIKDRVFHVLTQKKLV